MSALNIAAPPTSRQRLRRQAHQFRDMLGYQNEPFLPVVQVLETTLGIVAPGYEWDVVETNQMTAEHGLTLLDEKLVLIREDVYEGACRGRGRDRLTVIHEIAHAALHGTVPLARQAPGASIPRYRDPEWQADCFAGELLVDHRQIQRGMTPAAIAQEFGVSRKAAIFQLNIFSKEGLVQMRGGYVVF